jgi:hypothetical protein
MARESVEDKNFSLSLKRNKARERNDKKHISGRPTN